MLVQVSISRKKAGQETGSLRTEALKWKVQPDHLSWKKEDCNYSKKSKEGLCGIVSPSLPCGPAQPEPSLREASVGLIHHTPLGRDPWPLLQVQHIFSTNFHSNIVSYINLDQKYVYKATWIVVTSFPEWLWIDFFLYSVIFVNILN